MVVISIYDRALKERAREKHASGMSVSAIAREFGIAVNTARYWVDDSWTERQKQMSHSWIERNRERARANVDSWNERHPEYKTEYYAKNREHLVRGALERSRNNPARSKAYVNRSARRNKAYMLRYFRSHPCMTCGERDPYVLCCHHRNPNEKEKGVSDLLRGRSLERLIAEIEKCDVLCCNCHVRLHRRLERQERRGRKIKLEAEAAAEKQRRNARQEVTLLDSALCDAGP